MAAKLLDFGRALIAAIALWVGPHGVESLLGQGPVPPAVGMTQTSAADQPATANEPGGRMGPNEQITLYQWAAKEGGAFVVILVILFFYRRDWKTAVDFWRDQHAITTKLVQENTAAQVELSSALRENNVVVHQAKNVLTRLEGGSRP